MKMQKAWLTVYFHEGDASIEATLNYATKSYSLTHGSNCDNCTFGSEKDSSIQVSIDRAKCVTAALKFINQELFQ